MFEILKLRKLRLREQKKFNDNNLCLYDNITNYITATNLTSYEKEEILHQIMDMLLQAQYENRDKSFVVGDDYKEFCKNIITEYTNSKSKLYIVLDYVQRYLGWLTFGIIFTVLYNFLSTNPAFTISISQLLTCNMISLLLTFIAKVITRESILVPISGNSKLGSKIKYNANNSVGLNFCVAIFIISFLFNMILDKVFNIHPYTHFISLSNPVILIVILIVFIILLAIAVYKKQYNLKY